MDYLKIVRRQLLSPIVIAIALLAGALLYVGENRDAWFISFVIIVNSLIGIVQEIRARRALKKLELLSAPKARRVQGGIAVEVDYKELVVGDEIELLAGDELPADARLTEVRDIEINESMLTGESASVSKQVDDTLYASTSVVAGSARAIVTAIGPNTKAGKIGAVLKRYKPELTPLQRSIQRVVSWMTFGAIGLAVVIAIVYYFADYDSVTILKTIVSGAVTVVPEGLLLASSLLLAFGSLKLAQAKVLPQKLSAIEAMALLELLCVDKTGTLTSDEIVLDSVESFGDISQDKLSEVVAIVAKETSGGNATGQAIIDGLNLTQDCKVSEIMAFSSERKMSGIRVALDGQIRTFLLGAPEFIAEIIVVGAEAKDRIDELVKSGRRVLLAVELDDQTTPLKELASASGSVLGVVILTNPLRDGVKQTVEYLQDQGVQIKVISGDNPLTVQYIAKQVGIENSNRVTTGLSLASLAERDFAKEADKQVIFARVQPEQKERLIRHFRKHNLFTGMVGDGVNDALALKEADLGVAMYAGATVSRRVADVILLNNSFTSLPLGMKLGNRIMQAIELIATLFFHKIIYGIVLLLATMLVGMPYPYEPRHVTFMNIFLVTLPTLIWTLFPPLPKNRVNPSFFWRDTLFAVAPIALVTGLTVFFTYWIMSVVYPERPVNVATMTVLTATFFGVYMVFLVAKILGVTMNAMARRARLFYLIAVTVVAIGSFGLGPLRDFFDFSLPTVWILWPAITLIALSATIQWQMAKVASQKFKSQQKKNSAL